MATSPLIKAIVGSTQSKYAAWAITLTILVLCVSVLVTQTEIPMGKRLLGVLFMILITVPGVILSLVELTCLVTGGSWKTNWWCWLLAWIIAVIVIVWCLVIIVTTFNTILTYTNANKKIIESKVPATEEESNDFAENILDNADSIASTIKIDTPEDNYRVDAAVEVPADVSDDMDDMMMQEEVDLDKELDSMDIDSLDLDSQVFVENADGTIEAFSNCSSKKNHDHLEKFKNKKLKRKEKFTNKKKVGKKVGKKGV